MMQQYGLKMQSRAILLVAFDLDDTLYKERDYWYSGVDCVIDHIHSLGLARKQSKFGLMPDQAPVATVFDQIMKHYELPTTLLDSLLWIYRLHEPKIELSFGARSLLNWCQTENHQVAIISDGRSVTQRRKIAALGLDGIRCFISEEVGAQKPSDVSYLAASLGFKPSQCLYIADNVTKDFQAPEKLGWHTVGLKDDGRNIHPQLSRQDGKRVVEPKSWIKNLLEVKELIRSMKR
jgi:putative hydrolase of the HAD superfamily